MYRRFSELIGSVRFRIQEKNPYLNVQQITRQADKINKASKI